jgi:hypothetical protein
MLFIYLQPSLSFGGFGSTPSTQTPNAFQFPSFQPTQQGEFEISGACILASQSCGLKGNEVWRKCFEAIIHQKVIL